jgi:CheY-like chemotaxis protein
MMPMVDGFATLEQIKKDERHIAKSFSLQKQGERYKKGISLEQISM